LKLVNYGDLQWEIRLVDRANPLAVAYFKLEEGN